MTTASFFPAAELEAFYVGRIQTLAPDLAQEATTTHLTIRFCHRTPSGQFAPWIGFRSILEEAQRDDANDKAKCPALVFGMHSPDSIPANYDTAVLDWPGVKYLRYDVDDTELLAAFKGCLANCTQPLPPHLQQTPEALLNKVELMRHKFNGLRLPIKIRLARLNKAMKGEPFPPSQTRISQVLTSEQDKDQLKRLNGYESLAQALAPEIEGLKPFNDALQTFCLQWQEVAELARIVPDGGSAAVQAALKGWQQVQLTVEIIIKSLQLLEQAVNQRLERVS